MRDAAALAAAYRDGSDTPEAVVARAQAAAAQADVDEPPLRALIATLDVRARRDAAASTRRWRDGRPLSPLDGVPYVVKDNLDVAGQRTTAGSRVPLPIPARDAWVVDRLRRAGAVCVGKANMHELGAGTTGINPHYGTPRNPWDPARWCGGSSSGSACAVAAGVVPIAVGTDAGGSIRAPASFVGAVGLKPTFGRVSRIGMAVLCDTLDHIGPIARTCRDVAVALAAMAGVHPDDDETWDQPPLPDFDAIVAALAEPIAGVRVGVARAVLDGPLVDPEVAAGVRRAADVLADAGATLVDVEVPDLERSLFVGLVLLAAEGPSGLEAIVERHFDRLGADLRVMWRVGDHFTARDYLKAQRIRNQIRAQWAAAFSSVDLVLLPAAGIPAGEIRADALATGELDQATSTRAIAHTFPSNLTGYPAVSVPSGLAGGVPTGAQLVARPWCELLALRAAAVVERAGLLSGRPVRCYDV